MSEHLNRVLARELWAVINIFRSMNGIVDRAEGMMTVRAGEKIQIKFSYAARRNRDIPTYSLEVKIPEEWVGDLGFDTLLLSSGLERESGTVYVFLGGKPIGSAILTLYQIILDVPVSP